MPDLDGCSDDQDQSEISDQTHIDDEAGRDAGKTDQLRESGRDAEDRQEALVDEGIEETFPASDPVSVMRVSRLLPSPLAGDGSPLAVGHR